MGEENGGGCPWQRIDFGADGSSRFVGGQNAPCPGSRELQSAFPSPPALANVDILLLDVSLIDTVSMCVSLAFRILLFL